MALHTLCWLEFGVSNLERAKKFYGGLFNWEFNDWGPGYISFKPSEGIGGGLFETSEIKSGGSPLIYYEVEEIEPYLKKVADLGGKIEKGKTEIPNMGWYALLNDPDGNIVGIFKSMETQN